MDPVNSDYIVIMPCWGKTLKRLLIKACEITKTVRWTDGKVPAGRLMMGFFSLFVVSKSRVEVNLVSLWRVRNCYCMIYAIKGTVPDLQNKLMNTNVKSASSQAEFYGCSQSQVTFLERIWKRILHVLNLSTLLCLFIICFICFVCLYCFVYCCKCYEYIVDLVHYNSGIGIIIVIITVYLQFLHK